MKAWFAMIALGLAATAAYSEAQYKTLYEHKAWHVQVVGFDDGSISCLAEISEGTESFTIWADAESLVKVQFYSTDWDFGEGDTADLKVEIDRRGTWNITDAELYKQSVLVELPDSDEGTKFLLEVMRGSTLYLRDNDDAAVRDYSLAGSSASIQAMVECVDGIAAGSVDTNPFK